MIAEAGISYQGIIGNWAALADPVAVDLMREGLELMSDEDSITRVRAMSFLGYALVPLAVDDEPLKWTGPAVAMARRLGADDALMAAVASHAWAVRASQPAQPYHDVSLEAFELAERLDSQEWLNVAAYLLGGARCRLGRLEDARLVFDQSASYRSPLQGWATIMYDATMASATGRFDEHESLLGEATRLGAALGGSMESISCIQRMLRATWIGDFDLATELAASTAGGQMLASFPNAAWVAAFAGDLDTSASAYAMWEEHALPRLPMFMAYFVRPLQVDIVEILDDQTRAATLVTQLEPYSGELIAADSGCSGAADHALGRLLSMLGRHDEAIAKLRAAHELHSRLGLRVWVAQSGLALGRAIIKAGDAGAAHEALTEAAALGRELNMTPLVERAEALL